MDLRDSPTSNRHAEVGEPAEAAEQREIVRERLAEAEARIDREPLPRRCRPRGMRAMRSQESRTSATTSAYCGASCIVRGSPCMCIRQTAAPRRRGRRERARLPQARVRR